VSVVFAWLLFSRSIICKVHYQKFGNIPKIKRQKKEEEEERNRFGKQIKQKF
jgi:hypothetical protein